MTRQTISPRPSSANVDSRSGGEDKGQPQRHRSDEEATHCHRRDLNREQAAADRRPDGDLADGIAGDGCENGQRRMRGNQGRRRETRHRHGDRIDVRDSDEDRAGQRARSAKRFSDRTT